MKKWLAIWVVVLACGVAWAQEAKVRIQVVWTNSTGREFSAWASLDDWEASYDGTNWVATIQHSLFGSNGVLSMGRLICQEADIEAADPYRGLLLTDPNTNKWVISIDTNGVLICEQVTFSPEMSFSNRVVKLKEHMGKYREIKAKWNSRQAVQKRLEQVEKLLGLRPLDD